MLIPHNLRSIFGVEFGEWLVMVKMVKKVIDGTRKKKGVRYCGIGDLKGETGGESVGKVYLVLVV